MKRPVAFCGIFLAAALVLSGCTTSLQLRDNEALIPAEGTPISAMTSINAMEVAAQQFFDEDDDIYTTYFSAEEYSELYDDLIGTYGGIGAYFYADPDTGRGCISSVMPNSPALKAGIQAGDQLVSVDGEDVTGLDLDLTVAKVKGAEGTSVTLVFERPNVGEVSFTIQREIIEVSTVQQIDLDDYPDIAYVYINTFNAHTAEEFKEIWNTLQERENPPKGLILDVRSNPGGEVNAAVDLADLFVPKGQPIIWLSGQTGESRIDAKVEPLGIPLVMLQNEYSASSSEILLGAVQDSGSGVLVGTKSFGKGIIQTIMPLQGGTGLRATTTRYFTPKKRSIHGVGITPDIECPLPEDTSLAVTLTADPSLDPQLAKAIETLEEMLAE